MVYIQSTSDRYRVHNFDAACAMFGTIESALTYRLTSFEEVQSGKFDNLIKTNLFVGSVEFMQEVFKRVNKTPQPILNTDRPVDLLSLKVVRSKVENGETMFVKPIQQKLFSGLVVDKYSINSLNEFDGDLTVLVYNILPKILSEWRVYVMFNKIEDSRNYSGDFTISPDYEFVKAKIQKHKAILPSAYVMDIGVCEHLGENNHINTIIEFNDMYAIGNYGVENTLYYRMLRERYFEIMRKD